MTAEERVRQTADRIETTTTILIAVVAVITAAVVWRASNLSGQSTSAERRGIINTLRAEAARAKNLAYLYQQEADLAQSHVLLAAQIDYLDRKATEFGQAGNEAVAAILTSELNALRLADQGTVATTPLVADTRYRRDDGTYDLDTRFQVLAAENPDLAALDPGLDFAQADYLDDKALYLALTVIVFALAMFSLTLAQITNHRIRRVFLVIGVVIAIVALGGALAVELLNGALV